MRIDILRVVSKFERMVIVVLILGMVLTVALSTLELCSSLVTQILRPPVGFLDLKNLFEVFGTFFMVLIGLELIETIKGYLVENRIRVEIVFVVAMIAICRKVIILDINQFPPMMLVGIATLVIALAAGYFLVRYVGAKPEKSDGQ